MSLPFSIPASLPRRQPLEPDAMMADDAASSTHVGALPIASTHLRMRLTFRVCHRLLACHPSDIMVRDIWRTYCVILPGHVILLAVVVDPHGSPSSLRCSPGLITSAYLWPGPCPLQYSPMAHRYHPWSLPLHLLSSSSVRGG